jgi:hypothetical protein
MRSASREDGFSLADGFSLVELLVALGLTLGVTAAVYGVLSPAESMLNTGPEAADVQQRVRVAAASLFRDLAAAEEVFPYHLMGDAADPPGTFRRDVITVTRRPLPGALRDVRTYFRKVDDQAKTYQIVQEDNGGNDEPVVDHVVGLSFSYWGALPGEPCVKAMAVGAVTPLTAAELSDGPWCLRDDGATLFDADLLRIRMIEVALRVQVAAAALRGPAGALFQKAGTARRGSSYVPDAVVRFHVTPRNLNLAP